ncbi:MAG: hypothetical protein L0323_13920 [Planctomycetes bacterium]|nr:hypothetical protein [Planctomycetota bacterium]
MSRFEAWLLHVATALVAGTGAAYAVFLYLLEPADPFAVASHPLEPVVQRLHVLASPVLLFLVGVVWQRHVLKGLRSGRPERRHSGWALVLLLLPMVASGYFLQVAVEPVWRSLWRVVHLATSVAWALGYLAHLFGPRTNGANAENLANRRRAAAATAAATLGAPLRAAR